MAAQLMWLPAALLLLLLLTVVLILLLIIRGVRGDGVREGLGGNNVNLNDIAVLRILVTEADAQQRDGVTIQFPMVVSFHVGRFSFEGAGLLLFNAKSQPPSIAAAAMKVNKGLGALQSRRTYILDANLYSKYVIVEPSGVRLYSTYYLFPADADPKGIVTKRTPGCIGWAKFTLAFSGGWLRPTLTGSFNGVEYKGGTHGFDSVLTFSNAATGATIDIKESKVTKVASWLGAKYLVNMGANVTEDDRLFATFVNLAFMDITDSST